MRTGYVNIRTNEEKNMRGYVSLSDAGEFVSIRVAGTYYDGADSYYEDYPESILITPKQDLYYPLNAQGFYVVGSDRQRFSWRIRVERQTFERLNEVVAKNYPLNRSDIVNMAFNKYLDSIKNGYIQPKGCDSVNTSFNVEKKHIEKVRNLEIGCSRNAILMRCLIEYLNAENISSR